MYLQFVGNAAGWAARILGVAFFVFITLFVLAHAFTPEGLPPLRTSPVAVQLDSLALFLMVTGSLVGWMAQGVGAFMIAAGYAIWQLVERRLPWPPSLIEIPLVVAALYGIAWWCAKRPFTQHGPAAS